MSGDLGGRERHSERFEVALFEERPAAVVAGDEATVGDPAPQSPLGHSAITAHYSVEDGDLAR
jgi:hypothetical protein